MAITYYIYDYSNNSGFQEVLDVGLGATYPAGTEVRLARYYETSDSTTFISDIGLGAGSEDDGELDTINKRKATPYYTLPADASTITVDLFSGVIIDQYEKQYARCAIEIIPPGLGSVVFDIDFAFTSGGGVGFSQTTIIDQAPEDIVIDSFTVPLIAEIADSSISAGIEQGDATISNLETGPWTSNLTGVSPGDTIYVRTILGAEYSKLYISRATVYVTVDDSEPVIGGGYTFKNTQFDFNYRTEAAPGAVTTTSPNYVVNPSTTSVLEGGSVTFTINTANVSDGTTLYWTLSGTGITAEDFTGGSLSGSVTISSGVASVTLTTAEDAASEGSESFLLQLREGSTAGTLLTQSLPVTITEEDPIQRYPDDGQIAHHSGTDSFAYRFGEEWYKVTGTPISL